MRRIVGLAFLIVALSAPAAASADTVHFSGRSGKHRHWTWAPGTGLAVYSIAGTVSANLYGAARGHVADAAFGIFYDTSALGSNTVLNYGFQYRGKGGNWRSACVRGRCSFDSRAKSPWPGAPAGGQYLRMRLHSKRLRGIYEVRLSVQPISKGAGNWVGLPRSHTFRVRYGYCNCVLPSTPEDSGIAPVAESLPDSGFAPEPDFPPEPEPEPEPAPQPAPAPPPPPPAPPRDVCAGHPSDPSVVCVRDAGHTVDVCDRDADGHRAYARVITEASNPAFLSPYYDDNDSQPGCANLHFPSRVLSVAVCVQYEGCGPYKPT